MIGAGFIKDMISSYRNNRNLLKGKDGATYKNFDRTYITDSIISRKVPVYKEATPEYLEQLRLKLQLENKKERILRITLFFICGFSLGVIMYLILY